MRKPTAAKPTTNKLYQSPENYPPIAVKECNLQYAALLSNNFASTFSETTAIMQYNHQKWALAASNLKLSQTLGHIAMVEMKHLDFLGQLIVLLGGSPQYIAVNKNRPTYWNSRMIFADTTLPSVLQRNIQSEQYAIDAYQNQISLIQDEFVTAILARIILDEQVHLEIFKTFLENC